MSISVFVRTRLGPAFAAGLMLLVAGCGDDDRPAGPTTTLPAGADEFPTATVREAARGLLGTPEDDLAADVRIGRRGPESYALTEDYVLGRATVELDDDGDGYHVVEVTVELPDGPETFELTDR